MSKSWVLASLAFKRRTGHMPHIPTVKPWTWALVFPYALVFLPLQAEPALFLSFALYVSYHLDHCQWTALWLPCLEWCTTKFMFFPWDLIWVSWHPLAHCRPQTLEFFPRAASWILQSKSTKRDLSSLTIYFFKGLNKSRDVSAPQCNKIESSTRTDTLTETRRLGKRKAETTEP